MENLTIGEIQRKLAEISASSGWGDSLETNVMEIRKSASYVAFFAGTLEEIEELKEENDKKHDEIERLRDSIADLESQCDSLDRENVILRERLDKYPKGR